MKRIATLFTVLVLLVASILTLSSCAAAPLEGKTADEALEIINTKMTAQTALKTTMDMDISLDMPNIMTLTVGMEGTNTMKQSEDSLLMDVLMDMTMSMESDLIGNQSTDATSTMKYDGTTLYMTSSAGEGEDTYEDKQKATADKDALLAAMAGASGGNLTMNQDWNDWTGMKNATIEKKEDKYILTATESEDALTDAILGAADSISGMGGELEVTALSITMTCAPDGFCEKVELDMDVTLSVEGMDAAMGITLVAKYEKAPADFAVSAPADAAEYEEVDLDVIFPSDEDAE